MVLLAILGAIGNTDDFILFYALVVSIWFISEVLNKIYRAIRKKEVPQDSLTNPQILFNYLIHLIINVGLILFAPKIKSDIILFLVRAFCLVMSVELSFRVITILVFIGIIRPVVIEKFNKVVTRVEELFEKLTKTQK